MMRAGHAQVMKAEIMCSQVCLVAVVVLHKSAAAA